MATNSTADNDFSNHNNSGVSRADGVATITDSPNDDDIPF